MAENEKIMQNINLLFGNIEFSVILVALAFLIFACLRPKNGSLRLAILAEPLTFGREMSTLLKGVACIFILMSHYVALFYGTGLPNGTLHYVQIYAANIALVWFMFCSGYGMTLKSQSGGARFCELKMRILKIYVPLVLVCLLSMMVKYVFRQSPDLSLSYLLGLRDEWYVWCIIFFYVIFYVAFDLSSSLHVDITYILTLLMMAYFIFAYNFFGESQAHYYRFPLAFMAGHVVAKEKKGMESVIGIGMVMLTFFFMEFHFVKCYVIAFAVLYLLGVADKLFIVCHGILYRIGIVSYFFYLCHQRIAKPILDFFGFSDCLMWIILTILASYTVNWIFSKMTFKIFK